MKNVAVGNFLNEENILCWVAAIEKITFLSVFWSMYQNDAKQLEFSIERITFF